jgi:pimeloyl-ACP methyl ester carboxylesterase
MRVPYKQIGLGEPLVCLHSGWGAAAMPFDDAVRCLAGDWRVLIPDRTGYGRAEPITAFPDDFHDREAARLESFLRRLELAEPVVWGHSDGAVIAARWASTTRTRPKALVLESIHLRKRKAREFFRRLVEDPETLPPRVTRALAAEHGESYWKHLIREHSAAWLRIGDEGGEYFGDELAAIRCPTLVIVGQNDPHTPIEEAAELASRIPGAKLAVVPSAGHSPHSEPASAALVSEWVEDFLRPHRVAWDRARSGP